MAEFLMPSLGADMETGKLIEWEKHPGDNVKRGDVIAVVETQKGAIEIEVFEDGVLESCLVELDTPVPVGTVLAIIKTATDNNTSVDTDFKEVNSASEPESSEHKNTSSAEPQFANAKEVSAIGDTEDRFFSSSQSDRVKISPAAKREANKRSIDIASLTGTGIDGSIILADLEQSAKAGDRISGNTINSVAEMQSSSPESTGMRTAIAAAMSRSKREIPHYYLSHTITLTATRQFLQEYNLNRNPEKRLLSGALYMKALALAVKKYPEFNGFYSEDGFQQAESTHIGMAINIRGGGLVAPAIHDVLTLDLDTLMVKLRQLVESVRAGRFSAAALADPTITLSSLGERGVDSLYGVIYPPQVAIIGIGTPTRRPIEAEGAIAFSDSVTITLAADHRVSDGHRGALLLRKIDSLLQTPGAL